MPRNNHPGLFKKGQSGNPGGRPKSEGEVRELARKYTTEAVETLVAIMRNEKATDSARALAANSILDRGHGRPAQAMTVTTENKNIDEMTDAEQLQLWRDLQAADDDEPVESAPNGNGQGGQH
jgi:hypothetical protein